MIVLFGSVVFMQINDLLCFLFGQFVWRKNYVLRKAESNFFSNNGINREYWFTSLP